MQATTTYSRIIQPPQPGEYPEYALMYMKLVPGDGLLLQHLRDGYEQARDLLLSLTEEQLLRPYAEHKWTIKEVLVHIIDDERIYAYRALCFARNEKTPLPGFEQDEYAAFSYANDRSLTSILQEYQAVRLATIALFDGIDERALMRRGVANGNEATVRALGYHIAGHERHHLKGIRENYLR